MAMQRQLTVYDVILILFPNGFEHAVGPLSLGTVK